MNIVMKIYTASFEFVLMLTLISNPITTIDPIVWLWYFLCIALGFLLRIGMEHKEHRLTKASLLYQSICTVSWCFFMSLVWNYFFDQNKKGFEMFLFVNSLFAAFMVGQFEEVFKVGLKETLRIKLNRFLAVERSKEEIKP